MKAHDVKRLVAYYVKKYDTRNPFRLAEYLNVEVQTGPLGSRAGCYMFLKNHKELISTASQKDLDIMTVRSQEKFIYTLRRSWKVNEMSS